MVGALRRRRVSNRLRGTRAPITTADLSARQNFRRPGLGQNLLRLGNVQQIADTVVVRFKRGGIRLSSSAVAASRS